METIVTVLTVIAANTTKKVYQCIKVSYLELHKTKLPASNLTEWMVLVSGRFGTECCMTVQLDMRALKHKRYQGPQQKRK
jgi:hypothetical protein